ncbi:MAG: PQQ-binding-like beta-propeller repeat protein [Planctomycetaceae bacterium]
MSRQIHRALLLGVILLSLESDGFADWRRFRGPNGSGIAENGPPLPETWTLTEGTKWKLELPGRGVSGPIVVGNNVFVTAYSGYGRDQGQIEDLRRHLLCVDASSGKKIWQADIDAVQPEDPFSGAGVPSHGYASHTPTSDGERVYVFFGKSGVLAFDLQGHKLWQTSVGTGSGRQRWGSSASPVLVGDLVVINASDEAESLVALDAKTGDERWRISDPALANVWATPVLLDGKLIAAVSGSVWAINPATGEKLWSVPGPGGNQTNIGPVVDVDGKFIFVQASRDGSSVALVEDGPNAESVWTSTIQSRYSSPLVVDGHVFAINGDVITCLDARTGERIFQERLSGSGQPEPQVNRGGEASQERPSEGRGRFGGRRGRGGSGGRGGGGDYPSPVMANGRIYILKKSGMVHIVAPEPEFRIIGSADMTADTSGFDSTPAISDGKMFVRSETTLYCIGSRLHR